MIADVPDQASMAGIAMAIDASGLVTVQTTVLITPDEVDAAIKKSPSYRALVSDGPGVSSRAWPEAATAASTPSPGRFTSRLQAAVR